MNQVSSGVYAVGDMTNQAPVNSSESPAWVGPDYPDAPVILLVAALSYQ